MQTVLLVVHLIIALALVGVILLQKSEGGALGIGGGGGAGNIFSTRGVGNALTRATAVLAICFFLTSIALTVLATRGSVGGSAFDRVQQPNQQQQGTGSGGNGGAGSGDGALPQLGQEPPAPAQPTTPQVPTNQ